MSSKWHSNVTACGNHVSFVLFRFSFGLSPSVQWVIFSKIWNKQIVADYKSLSKSFTQHAQFHSNRLQVICQYHIRHSIRRIKNICKENISITILNTFQLRAQFPSKCNATFGEYLITIISFRLNSSLFDCYCIISWWGEEGCCCDRIL